MLFLTCLQSGSQVLWLKRGGEIDTERASVMLLDEYRAGKLGRITLERPCDYA